MTGGLMQLVAYGAQDIYLTGDPSITYFKNLHRRHTNFAMESIQQTLNGTANFGGRVSCTIARSGDLVKGLTLEATLPQADDSIYIDDVGHHLIQEVEVEVGGQRIDKHYGDWLEIWAQLTVPAGKEKGYRAMIGQGQTVPSSQAGVGEDMLQNGTLANTTVEADRKIYVPLQFWFCRNVGLALPLIALQYHEVKVNIQFAAIGTLLTTDAGLEDTTPVATALEASLWADYVYLDTDERRRFAQVSHEYLIEQLQFSGDSTYAANTNPNVASVHDPINLNFNHPVKELIWVARETGHTSDNGDPVTANDLLINQLSNFTDLGAYSFQVGANGTALGGTLHKDPSILGTTQAHNIVRTAKLRLNGQDRFATRDGTYFNRVQPYQHHTRIPQSPGINVYSFALKPEDHQPSGTCNFSRIDNARLELTLGGQGRALSGGVVKVYATNYNVFRVMSGMGGTAYSN